MLTAAPVGIVHAAALARHCEDPVPASQATQPAEEWTEHDRYEQILREGFELLDDGERASALRALNQAVQRPDEEVLRDLEAYTLRVRNTELDTLVATTRLIELLADAPQDVPRLRFATRYEADALGRLLAEIHDAYLGNVYQERTVREWSATPRAYRRLHDNTRGLEHDARMAASMIAARLRYDPALDDDRATKVQLADTRLALSRLVAHLRSLPGFTSLPRVAQQSDPTLEAVRAMLRARAEGRTVPDGPPTTRRQDEGAGATGQGDMKGDQP